MPTPTTSHQFRALFDSHHRALHAYCLRRLPVDEANDAVSEVFLVALRRPESVPGGAEALLWLYGVARNVVRNHQRSSRRRTALVLREGSLAVEHVQGPDVLVLRSETQKEVCAAIETLRPDDQEVVRLKVWEGLSNGEIGKILGITDRAVEGRYARALRKLARILDGDRLVAPSSPPSTETGEVE